MNYLSLSSSLMQTYLHELQSIDEAMMIGLAEPWTREHFLFDLPGKWECSWVTIGDDGRLAGFIITSVKHGGLHVHRIAVAPFRQCRGLGRQLLICAAQSAWERGIFFLTLIVAGRNQKAIGFYRRLGFNAGYSTDPYNFMLFIPCEVLLLRSRNEHNRIVAP